MDTSRLDVTSVLVDNDEVASSSRPTTPALSHRRLTVNMAPTVRQEEEENTQQTAQLSRKKDKLTKAEKKERKKQKKIERKEKKERKGQTPGAASDMQTDGPSDVTTTSPQTPNFDLAGNIVTVPAQEQTTSDVTRSQGTTKSPNSWLDVGPPLIVLTTKSPDVLPVSSTSTHVPENFTPNPTVSKTTTQPSDSTGSVVMETSTPIAPETGVDKTKADRNKERRRERWLKRQARRLKCPEEDFRNSPEGYKCCLKSAKCFENLPEDIDEVSEGTNETSELSAGNFADACGKIDDALVCMANVLGRDKCKSAAQIVNKDLSEELLMVDRFHKQHCSKTPGGPATISPNPNIPGGQGHISTSGSSSSLPTSAVIGAAIGGLFIIVLIIAIVCIARRKKSRSQTQDKVAFHNPSSSDSSSRYKEFLRPSSEVYAEIDEKHLQRSFRVSNDTTFEKEEGSGGSTGSRPLPTAPSDGVYEDKAGYLTPKASRENLNNKTGYDELSNVSFTEESISGSYDKLARATADAEEEIVDGDYITPESEPAEERTIPDNHHTYFVLEK
uniref:Uncharacterized protein LOC111105810 isoform X2 n=1 Tax=Crassostrea virginica TaxID=6565 RepID=A0A8B8AYT4_CRAVI|nr:uncharacterized protein LOC111105810 isoform X2 [Crassostrea virginica]